MGLPIFREPEEKRESTFSCGEKKSQLEISAAHARSAIRRPRPSSDRRLPIPSQHDFEEGIVPLLSLFDASRSDRNGYLRVPESGRAVGRQQTRSPASMSQSSGSSVPAMMAQNIALREEYRRRLAEPETSTQHRDSILNVNTINEIQPESSFPDSQRPQSRRGLSQFPAFRPPSDSRQSDNNVARPFLRRLGNRSISEATTRYQARLPHESESSDQFRSILDPQNDMRANNGLGDRNRSPSPAESSDSPYWDTFLTTIAPDPFLPSASTSFTSSAAAANTHSFHSSSDPSQEVLLPVSADTRLRPRRRAGAPHSHLGDASDPYALDLGQFLDCPHHRESDSYNVGRNPGSEHRRQHVQRLSAIDRDLQELSERHRRFTAQYNAYAISGEEARHELGLVRAAFDRIVDLRQRLSALLARMDSTPIGAAGAQRNLQHERTEPVLPRIRALGQTTSQTSRLGSQPFAGNETDLERGPSS